MTEYETMTAQQLNEELTAVQKKRDELAAQLQAIETMPHPVEPVQGAYKVGKIGKLLINAALVTLVLLVFVGKAYFGYVLAVFFALGVAGVIVGKVEAKSGMKRYEVDAQTFTAEKQAYDEAQTKIPSLKYEIALLQQKRAALKEQLTKVEA